MDDTVRVPPATRPSNPVRSHLPIPSFLLADEPPSFWPRFTSSLRSLALTARVGRVLGIMFTVCFITGMLSHYQYHPWGWLPEPASPVWGYRLTQGLHVLTGFALIPLLLVKLWSVYPKLFAWPSIGPLTVMLERASIAVLVSSSLVQLLTGFLNVLDWYPWPWDFVPVHRFLGYVMIGSLAVHVAVKLPLIQRGLAMKVATSPTLTEKPDTNELVADSPPRPVGAAGISRRGLLWATAGGLGVVVATSVGQVVTPLQSIGLFATRRKKDATQLELPVNRTAEEAAVTRLARNPSWALQVRGPYPYAITLTELTAMVESEGREASLPIACVEGWSVGAHWRGLRLLDVISRAGGNSDSYVKMVSLEPMGSYNYSFVHGGDVSRALLATHLNGERLTVDHGYPLRLIAPDRAGVLNTKWLKAVEVL